MKHIFALLLCLWSWGSLLAQDPIFSQFYAAPMQLNPALAGIQAAPSFALAYRNQWPDLNNAYVTYSASYSQYFPRLNSSFGTQIIADVAGDGLYNTTQVLLNYAYDLRFSNDQFIRMGLEAGFVNSRLDWQKLVFLDQIDVRTGATTLSGQANPTEELPPANQNISYPDFGFGFLYYSKYWYAGVSFRHLNAPNEAFLRTNESFGTVPGRLMFHAGGEIPLKKSNKRKAKTFLSPNVLFAKQGQFSQLQLQGIIRHDFLFGGIGLRHTFTNADAVIFTAGVREGVLRIGYSYDWTVSQLAGSSGGAHELSLLINLQDPDRGNARRHNDCMGLFR